MSNDIPEEQLRMLYDSMVYFSKKILSNPELFAVLQKDYPSITREQFCITQSFEECLPVLNEMYVLLNPEKVKI